MAALNFQTPDKELQINQAWFAQNQNCGYVLKPDVMLEGIFFIFSTISFSVELQLDQDALTRAEPSLGKRASDSRSVSCVADS